MAACGGRDEKPAAGCFSTARRVAQDVPLAEPWEQNLIMSITTFDKPRVKRKTKPIATSFPALHEPDNEPDNEADHAREASPVFRQTGDEIFQVELDDLATLACNPVPHAEDIERIAEAFRWRGQDEPIIVLAAEHVPEDIPVATRSGAWSWLVLAGATRIAAAKRCGWARIAARTRQQSMTREELLGFAFRNNLDRRQVTTAEKASYAAALAESLADGEGRDAAIAEQMGLQRSEVNQLLRFADLPAVWQQRVIRYDRDRDDPEGISWTCAKCLLPYVHLQPVMEGLEECWGNPLGDEYEDSRTALQSKKHARELVVAIVKQHTRPADSKEPHDYGYQSGGYIPRRYELTDDLRQQLDIQQLPLGENGAKVPRICNVELNDQLMKPHLEKELASRSSGRAGLSKPSKSDKKPAGKLTAAEERAKAKQQDQQLTDRIRRPGGLWEQGLRLAIASRIEPKTADTAWLHDDLVAEARESEHNNTLHYRQWRLQAQNVWYFYKTGKLLADVRNEWQTEQYFNRSQDCYLAANPTVAGQARDASDSIRYWTTRFLLWPVSPSKDWAKHERLAPHDRLPTSMVHIPQTLLWRWATLLSIDVSLTWSDARSGSLLDDCAAAWLESFLRVHNRRQLADLAKELGVGLNGCKTLGDEVDRLLRTHCDIACPLAKSLAWEPPAKKKR